jgi:hypothetical protein
VALESVRSGVATTQLADPTTVAAPPATSFDDVMKRIAAHATSVETLANGAKLYHLPGGREIEQVPGKSPYVTKHGTWPPPSTTPPAK